MAITNAQAIAYCNEVLRPMCEKFRNIKEEVDAALVTWDGQISAVVPDDSGEVLEDGRAADGVSVINGEDINDVIGKFTQYQTALDVAGAGAIISKPCVRPLSVEY